MENPTRDPVSAPVTGDALPRPTSSKTSPPTSSKSRLKDSKMVAIGLFIIILLNLALLNICPILGCYDVSFVNLFRGNLLCNACTDMSYHIQKYQMQLYFAIGGFFVTKMNSVIGEFVNTKSE